MSIKGLCVTKGTPEYFAEREKRMQGHIDTAKAKIDEIEAKVRAEIDEITAQRNTLRRHLEGFLNARDALVASREKTEKLIDALGAIIVVCDAELPQLDSLLSQLDGDYAQADTKLDETEKGKRRQLHKHERTKTKYELRKVRLDLRRRLTLGEQPTVRDPRDGMEEDEAIARDLEGGPQNGVI